jgi:hypothetical protein
VSEFIKIGKRTNKETRELFWGRKYYFMPVSSAVLKMKQTIPKVKFHDKSL